jgi:hypothetical protein
MPNSLYTPTQVAAVAAALAKDDSFLSALVSRDFQGDALISAGKTIDVRVPGALIARSRDIDETRDAIVLDSLSERTVPVSLGAHIYNAVILSEGDITLRLEDFAGRVLRPQVEAVVDGLEHLVAEKLRAVPLDATIEHDPSDPVSTFTKIRAKLRQNGTPATGLVAVVGTAVYAALLDARAITDTSASGSTAALREAQVGLVRGFTIVESTRVDEDEIIAFHRSAFTLVVRAPKVPEGASFGETVNEGGHALRYLRDYDPTHTVDRSVVSTFAGVTAMPLLRVDRDYTAGSATVTEVPNGAAIRLTITDAGA